MDLFIRPFGRAESGSVLLEKQRAAPARSRRDYTKRPSLASHALRGNTGGYSRNAHRLNDERKYLVRRRRVLYLLPVLTFFIVAGMALWGPFVGQPQTLSAQQTDLVNASVQPSVVPLAGASDEKPASNYLETYTTAPTLPRILTIDSIGIQARVFEVGLDGRSQPQLPRNSYDAGWYNVSALPGESGAMVLSGACSGSVGQGVFYRLNELKVGARLKVERGDGTQFSYEVEAIETVALDTLDMAKVLSPIDSNTGGLNLIGCTGTYDAKTNDFAKRTVLYAFEI